MSTYRYGPQYYNWWGGETSLYELTLSVIGRLHQLSSQFTLTMLTILSLSECHLLAPASSDDWFNKGHAMCFHVYMIMHVKDL